MKKEIETISNTYVLAVLLHRYVSVCKRMRLKDLIQGIHDLEVNKTYCKEPFPLHLDIFFYLDVQDIHRIVYIKVCDTYRFEKKLTFFKEEGVALQVYAMHRQKIFGLWIFTDPPKTEQGCVRCGYQYVSGSHQSVQDIVMVHIPMINRFTDDFEFDMLYKIFYQWADEEEIAADIDRKYIHNQKWN